MGTAASRGYLDRVLVGVAGWTLRRLRARGPLPARILVDAGLARIVDGDAYVETATPGSWMRLPGVADAPPPRPDAWRRSTYWSQEPEPPRPTPWFRRP
jgi:hypothetical protein